MGETQRHLPADTLTLMFGFFVLSYVYILFAIGPCTYTCVYIVYGKRYQSTVSSA